MIWIMSDWDLYRAAFLALLNGINPYSIGAGSVFRFYYPVWSLIVVAPFAWLGYPGTNIAVVVLYLTTMLLVARKFKMGRVQTVAFLTSGAAVYGVGFGNIGFITLLGLLFPTPIALFFLIIKPQSTAIIMLLLVWNEYKQGGWRQALRAVLPVGIAVIVCVIIFGIPTPPDPAINPTHNPLFPWCLIVSVPLTIYSLRKNSMRWASVASTMTFPYMNFSGFQTAALGFPIATWVLTTGWLLLGGSPR